jgi:predicted lysophospholipase L1 biosynthesis ABC-type transport system permease subunit
MKEKDLLQVWNSQRSQRISSQLAPTILLAATLALVATGKLTYRSPVDVKAFAVGLVAAGGAFSLTGMLASIKDSLALTRAMREVNDLSQLGVSVLKNSGNLSITAVLFVALSLFNFVALALFLYKRP